MGCVKLCRGDREHEESVRFAKHDLFMESNPLFILLHEPATFLAQLCEIACIDCRPVLKHIESFSYLVQRGEDIVFFCESFDDWGHPVADKIPKQCSRELVTVIECVTADGYALPPMYIYKESPHFMG